MVATIPPQQLLVFDIEADDPEELCRFCDLPVSGAVHYAHLNQSGAGVIWLGNHLLGQYLPGPVKRAVRLAYRLLWRYLPGPVKQAVRLALGVGRKGSPSGATGSTADRSR